MAQNICTLKLTGSQEKKLFDAWKETQVKTPPYARWQLRPENCVITCYESGKTVFQGKDAEVYASPFMKEQSGIRKTSSERKHSSGNGHDIFPQAGSDEVGTGDYFGPVCVCATIVTKEDDVLLRKLGVRDSKQLRDSDIRKIAPQIMKQLTYSLLILPDEKYNEVHAKYNLNALKSILHNQAYVNLTEKAQLPEWKIVDQFTPERSYYRYLKDEPVVIRNIHFETKAEDKYPAVGAASVIARYAFLTYMDEMEKKWNMKFQKGAGSNADACARDFVKRYSKEKLGMVAKLHFKNTEKL